MKAQPLGPITKEQEQRFWSRVRRGDHEECWNWTGYARPDGYGGFRLNGRMVLSHRVAYAMSRRRDPAAMLVCHRCDNRLCCNPSHLFLGTYLTNNRDRMVKGRNGARPNAKLSVRDAQQIRDSDGSSRVLAKRFGVDSSVIQRVRANRIWKDASYVCRPHHSHLEACRRGRAAKLAPGHVAAIRDSTKTTVELGQLYGVHNSTISRIRRGRTWRNA
jgi:hypothetical protein